ncbi:MBL fold metallo-hydrolase [Anaeromicropila populeti]|uniref:7,8-dihydropterin-6-yl-methyl-4-(Beta-D-ribofuranosyl)aminobenzene 5'-phosphate synthase n=1 Tax=Anaeromicropila populeti TaxID=37658 RepID=A0A1I6K5F2_9FIRM|nr:MBL fold metallo-hydrolase [Anaeromicropila populeti]SFR86426.1 7,8-dihydropterin-6-yl-methyl-4-(beta-D-ribofuranosyl)aminobenzene 5'-phosphate synthase [Anaeromicropila populeti]
MIKITTLIEDRPDENNEMVCEHGLSLYIEAGDKKILFDTGQTGAFIQNADKLNKDLAAVDYVMISHGHYDHSGGFRKLAETVPSISNLIVGAEFFELKYKTIGENQYKFVGTSFGEEYLEEQHISRLKIEEEIFSLSEDIMLFHKFEKHTKYETLKDKFYIKSEEVFFPDLFLDEVVMGIKTDKGLVVIAGCSHVGIVNILKTIEKRTNMPIYAVIGGTHLIDADAARINQTINDFKDMNIQVVAVSHCTGEVGTEMMKNAFQDKFILNNTGKVIEF